MASSGANGPQGYTRLDIKDKKLTEIRDDELINQEIKINEDKGFDNTTVNVDTPANDYLWKEGHLPDRWNLAKEVNLWIGNYTTSRGDWHKMDTNKMCEVSPRVRLYSESISSVGMRYSQEFGDAQEMKPLASLMGDVKTTIETANAIGLGGTVPIERFTPYDKPQVFKDVKHLEMSNPVKFEFHFGQAGLFSGLEEVVKPIYAILSLFALGDKTNVSSFGDLPFPTDAQFTVQWLSSAFNALKDGKTKDGKSLVESVKSAFKGGQEKSPSENGLVTVASGAVDAAAVVYNTYFDAVNAGGQAIFKNKDTNYNLAFFQTGNFTFGPFLVGSFEWQFDMSNIDEEGFPIYGWVQLGGLKYPARGNRGQIAATLFSGVKM